jgi:hypothetical protein
MASEISALAGRHKYKSSEEAIINHMIYYENSFVHSVKENLIMKSLQKQYHKKLCDEINHAYPNDHVEYTDENISNHQKKIAELENTYPEIIVPKYDTVTVTNMANNIKSMTEFVNNLKEEIVSIAKTSNIETIQDIEDIVKEITNDKDDNIANNIHKLIPAISGIVKEDSVVNQLISFGYEVKDCQSSYKYKTTINNINVCIYCKVDGLLYKDNKAIGIVEIKTRQKVFFEPQYDLDQLACYIVASNLPIGMLVQSLNGDIKINEFETEFLLNTWLDLISSDQLFRALQKIKDYRDNPNSVDSLSFAENNFI